MINKKI